VNKLTRFYRELRRRQVFGVVALYAVASWAVIEVGDMAIDSGFVSGLITRDLFTLALIGFPLMLIAGWFYDITRTGLYRTPPAGADPSFDIRLQPRDYLFLLLLLAIWSGAFLYLHTPPAVEKSIAVLPFENRGNDPENATFAFGIHDDLMTQLQRVGDLKLIAAQSVRAIDRDMPIRLAGLKLGVAYIMKGTVERILNRMRVSVVLLDAGQGQQVWAGSFDRDLSAVNVFDVRDEITKAITGKLQSVLSPKERARVFDLPTTSLEASSHYARGRQLLVNRRPDDLLQALKEFETAVELDPQFALAWAGMADAAMLAGDVGAIGNEEDYQKRDLAVNRAMALNEELAEVWVAYGDLLPHRGAPQDEIIAALEKAIELSPNYALAYHRYAMNLSGWENSKQRLALYQKAMQLDPITPVYKANAAMQLLDLGRDREAMQVTMSLVESNPEFYGSYINLALLQARVGHFVEAIEWIKKGLQTAPANANLLDRLSTFYITLNAWDHVAEVRQIMVETLSPDDIRVPLLDFRVMEHKHDWPGLLELLDKLPAFWSDKPPIRYARGSVFFDMGDMPRAREYWEGLKRENWAGWPKVSEGNCLYVQVIMEAGDRALGHELLNQALQYLEVTMPGVTSHTDLDARQGICYLLEGEPDKALQFYQQRVDHGHVDEWWRTKLNHLWDPLREDPRFIAIDEKVEERIANQREHLFGLELSEKGIQQAK